jgi:hypothetical protein
MPRQVLHPHAQCYFRFHQCRGLRTNSRPARRRAAPRGPLQRSTTGAVGRRGQADFVTDRVNRPPILPTDRKVSIDTIL